MLLVTFKSFAPFASKCMPSTLCLKQHVFIDIPAAILTVEIAAVISKKLKVHKLFAVFNRIGISKNG